MKVPGIVSKRLLEAVMRIHTTSDGTKIKLCDMTNSHLAATIRMIERKASEGITVRMGGGSCPDDFCYDEDRLKGKTALEHMGYADYVKELDRRISKRRKGFVRCIIERKP